MTADSYTFHDGAWHEGNPPMFGPMVHSLWMASAVFDGARAFGRVAPDLDRHCERVIESAKLFGMTPEISAQEIENLAWHGIEKFPEDVELWGTPARGKLEAMRIESLLGKLPELFRKVRSLADRSNADAANAGQANEEYDRPAPEPAAEGEL